MVFRKGGRSSSTNLRSHGGPGLVMECWEEALSPSQVAAFKQKVLECQKAQEKVKEAHQLAAIGMAVVTVLDDPRKAIPPSTLKQLCPDLHQVGKAPPSEPQDPPRSTSPDIIFIGESPPIPKTSPIPNLVAPPQPRPMAANSIPAIPRQLIHRFPSYQMQTTPTALQIQGGSIRFMSQVGAQVTPVQGTYGIGVKRALPPQPLADISPKRKKAETDNEGNWVPLDEFYYGKSEGDPSYTEEKSEFRFKCWYCNKMLYNNIKAMMHIQGHIDSSKQQNIDLSDLTQCKHCYRQFDTPFEMQTHVEKVHMSNVNVLMCRICERDHQSRQALMTHMRVNHNACEMPYICQLCKFRSSMYSDVVDHFKKKHDSSQHILCLYCLKVFNVKFVSQGWGQTQTYYGHLLKHQSKSSSKKCTYCRLTFVNPGDCKNHKKKDHAANQKGIDSCHSAFGQDMMIKVPESGLVRKQSLKSLNAPAVSKVLDFGGTRFPYAVNFNTCVECKTVMGTPDHFRKHIECSMCRFATSCSIAYANHMMGFHSGQMTSLNLNIPWERPMKDTMHCLCGFASRYGNKIANHLVYCTKRSCYSTKPAQVERHVEEQEEQDPRHKPGASLLDVLGLVKKKNIATKDRVSTDTEIQRRRSSEETSEVLWKSSETPTAPPTEEGNQEEDRIPQELKGAEKWKTVKIKDPSTPTKASVFLGAAEETGKEVETAENQQDLSAETEEKITIKREKDEIKEDIGQSSLVDDNDKQEEEMEGRKEEGESKDEEDDKIKVEEGGSEDTNSERRKMSTKEDEDSLLDDQNDNAEEDVKKESCSKDDKVEKEDISVDIIDSSVGDGEEDIKADVKESEEGELECESVEDSFLMEDQGPEGNLDEEVGGEKQAKFHDEEEERKEELMEEDSYVGDQMEDIKEGDEEKLESAECSNTEGGTVDEEIEDGEKKSVEEDEATSEKEEIEMDEGTEETEKGLEDERRSEGKVEDQSFEEETIKDKTVEGDPMEDQHGEGERMDDHPDENKMVEDQQYEEEKLESPKIEEEKQQETEESITESVSGGVGNQETVSDSLVDEGAKSVTLSEDSDKIEKQDPTPKQTEEKQRDKDTDSPSHSEKRSERSHHHHHHDNHSGDRGDHYASDRQRPRSDQHDNRDSYRHQDSRRHTENRHQYDSHLYDNRRHGHHDNRYGHHDNRHGHHDSRHGYHDNRHGRHGYHGNRGHWGGRGNYRGGFRDNNRY